MEIELFLPEDSPKQSLLILKDSLDKSSIEGLENAEIVVSTLQKGQMGAGVFLNSIKTIIEAAHKPLTELVRCLQKYVDNYRTKITIPTKYGEPIVLEHGRSMTAEEITKLVTAIQQNNT